MKKLFGFLLFLAMALVASNTQATLITSPAGISSPTVIDFSQFAGMGYNFTFGPDQIGGVVGLDVVFTANPWNSNSGQGSVLGSGGYGLGGNGTWGGAMTYSGLDADTGGMTYTFNFGLVSAVGGFMNYAPDASSTDVLIEALAADGTTVLESYVLNTAAPISTPGGSNDGAFRGIGRLTADIGAFRVSNGYVVLDDLTFGGGAVIPEPSTILLLGAGLAGLGFWSRRKMKK